MRTRPPHREGTGTEGSSVCASVPAKGTATTPQCLWSWPVCHRGDTNVFAPCQQTRVTSGQDRGTAPRAGSQGLRVALGWQQGQGGDTGVSGHLGVTRPGQGTVTGTSPAPEAVVTPVSRVAEGTRAPQWSWCWWHLLGAALPPARGHPGGARAALTLLQRLEGTQDGGGEEDAAAGLVEVDATGNAAGGPGADGPHGRVLQRWCRRPRSSADSSRVASGAVACTACAASSGTRLSPRLPRATLPQKVRLSR